jgi:hypothetical protein
MDGERRVVQNQKSLSIGGQCCSFNFVKGYS